jgi:hypothetical protein
MLIVRTVPTALIAFSVAMVPATGEATVSTKPVEMSMTDHGDVPCFPPDDCKGSIACVIKCLNFVGAVLAAMVIAVPNSVDTAPLSFVDSALHGHVISPPTHPPPV